jgi:hypothetical protein
MKYQKIINGGENDLQNGQQSKKPNNYLNDTISQEFLWNDIIIF